MRSLRIVFQIFSKEIKEGFRDPKTILCAYVLPLIIYPLFAILMFEVAAVQLESLRTEKLTVLLSGSVPNELQALFQKEKNVVVAQASETVKSDLKELKSSKIAKTDLRKTLQAQKVAAIYSCETLSGTGLVGQDVRCSIYDDPSDSSSERVESQLMKASETYQKTTREQRLKVLKVSEDLISPFSTTAADTAGVVRSVNKTLGHIIPLYLIMILYMSSFYPALNATVGERERGTYATLITLPIDPSQIVVGKFLAIGFFCFIGVLSYFGPPWFASRFISLSSIKELKDLNFVLPNSLALFFAILLATGVLLSAVSVCVGFFARKMNEAQGYYSMLMMAMIVPVIFSESGSVSLNAVNALIPLFNFVLVLRTYFVDPINGGIAAEVVAINFLATGFFLWFSSYSIRAEYRYDTLLSDLLTFKKSMVRHLTPAISVMLFIVFLGSIFYLDLALAKAPTILTISVTHLLVLIGLPLAMLRYYGLSIKDSFKFTMPSLKAVLAAVLAGGSCLFVVTSFLPEFRLPKEMTDQWANSGCEIRSSFWRSSDGKSKSSDRRFALS